MRHRRQAVGLAASAIAHLLVPIAPWLMTLSKGTPPHAEPSSIRVFAVPVAEDPHLPGLRPRDAADTPPAVNSSPASLRLGPLRIDVREIAQHLNLLFPALTPGLAIDSFFSPAGQLSAPLLAATDHRSPLTSLKPPLVLSDRDVQSIVDRSWARRDRWEAFQVVAGLLETHAPGGVLPRILHEYRAQNALQPYADRESLIRACGPSSRSPRITSG